MNRLVFVMKKLLTTHACALEDFSILIYLIRLKFTCVNYFECALGLTTAFRTTGFYLISIRKNNELITYVVQISGFCIDS